jgi:tetratricopeptide (TPR) repeat protein
MKTSLTRLVIMLLSVCALLFVMAPMSVPNAEARNQDAAAVMELLQRGSYYYLKHDFKAAIPPYQEALDLEKEERTLDKTLWRVLVDNLGMAYGITGDLDKAKDTFEYGISKDPEYPLFYYNMACTYGEKHDMDKAIEYLKLAFARQDNMIPGEHMPNPATDSSFKRFVKNEKFQTALKELKQK